MDSMLLKNEEIEAVFSPSQGMNLLSLRKKGIELIDPKTKPLFEERCAGLGSLIGPHFHHRPLSEIPPVPHESLFPHIARVRAKGVLEPFSHGIARYAPWKAELVKDSILAKLSGEDLWHGVALKELEGFSFEMELKVQLLSEGISLDFSIEAEKPSVLGFHYYYTLPLTGGRVRSKIEPIYRILDEWKQIPSSLLDPNGDLSFDAMQECDVGFISKDKEIFYENEDFSLKISYEVEGESSFQLYRPKGASYLCIEPLTAKNPKHPMFKKTRIQLRIEVLPSDS